MTRIAKWIAAMTLALNFATPALVVAAPANGGAGSEYGQHHATHAQESGGFTADMNPGVKHKGFSGWTGM